MQSKITEPKVNLVLRHSFAQQFWSPPTPQKIRISLLEGSEYHRHNHMKKKAPMPVNITSTFSPIPRAQNGDFGFKNLSQQSNFMNCPQ
jgi:hypothetical protein